MNDILRSNALLALLVKEFHQLFRNKQLLIFLIATPVIQLLMYGFALSPEVKHLRLGVIDYSNSPISRDLTSYFIRNELFDLEDAGTSETELFDKVRNGKIDTGMVIPPDLERRLKERKPTRIQLVFDGTDANTAGIAVAYASQLLAEFGRFTGAPVVQNSVVTSTVFLYNPGLVSSWFFVPGVIGMVLVIAGIMVSSATLLREKETGTLEQLLMTPVTSAEILIGKIIPLVTVLFVNIAISLSVAMLVFHVPFRGNPFTLFVVSLLSIFVVISVGMALSTIASNQRQAMLISFFINMPVIQLSGALSPLESMPELFRNLSLLNPLRYFIVCLKGVLLKGVGLQILWPEILTLVAFAFVLLTLSASRFRKQLS